MAYACWDMVHFITVRCLFFSVAVPVGLSHARFVHLLFGHDRYETLINTVRCAA
jgi:hypothetical protein